MLSVGCLVLNLFVVAQGDYHRANNHHQPEQPACIWGKQCLGGMEGWGDLSDEKKREFAAAANGVPDNHVEGLSDVYILNDYLDAHDAAGIYFPRANQQGTIYFHSENSSSITVAHEIGHHVWHKSLSPTEVIDVNHDKGKALTRAKPGGVYTLQELGLRQYSISHAKEFWADSYSVWARARQGNKACKGFQVNYREFFPETAELLDDLFG